MQPRPAIPPRLVSRLRPCDPRVASHQSPVSAHQSLNSLESADPRRLLSNKQNAPISPSESALTNHFQLIEKSDTLSPVESAITIMPPVPHCRLQLTPSTFHPPPPRPASPVPRHPYHGSRATEHWTLLMTQQLTFNLMPDRKTWTVSELTGKIRDLLAKNFTDISVQGEISNCREAQSGHIYFTLTDDRSQVRCVYFNQHQRRIKLPPADGPQAS